MTEEISPKSPQVCMLNIQNTKHAQFFQKDFIKQLDKDIALNIDEIRKATEYTTEVDPNANDKIKCDFHHNISGFKNAVNQADLELSHEKEFIKKFVDNLKAIKQKGEAYSKATEMFSQTLVEYGAFLGAKGNQIGNTFTTFSTVFREMSQLTKTLTQHLANMLTFPLDSIQKNQLRQDRKRKVEKSSNEWEDARRNLIQHKNKQLKKSGMNKMTYPVDWFTVDLLKERRKFQYEVAEYWHWINDINLKKGVEFANGLMNYFHMLQRYFTDGADFLKALQDWCDKKTNDLSALKTLAQEDQKDLEKSIGAVKEFVHDPPIKPDRASYSLHAAKGDSVHGIEKSGILYKRTDAVVLKTWQRRYCQIADGFFKMSNSQETKATPTSYPMLTCAVTQTHDILDKKYTFQLITHNKTILFGADSKQDMEEWVSVLLNAKNKIMEEAFSQTQEERNLTITNLFGSGSEHRSKIVNGVIETIRQLPGNNICADCSRPKPEWFSVNLGVLVCIECSGLHREMGVQYSRIRSLSLDEIKTSELLTSRMMGNDTFNDNYEAALISEQKLDQNSDMEERRKYITAKYIDRKFVVTMHTGEDANKEAMLMLQNAVINRDTSTMLQAYGEKVDFTTPLPNSISNSSILHFAIEQEDNTSLHIVDFLISNSAHVIQKDIDGNTPFHTAAKYGKTPCLKLLLLKTAGEYNYKNIDGKTPLDIAKENDFEEMISILVEGKQKRIDSCLEFLEIDWGLTSAGSDNCYEDLKILGGTSLMEETNSALAELKIDFNTNVNSEAPIVPPRRKHSKSTSHQVPIKDRNVTEFSISSLPTSVPPLPPKAYSSLVMEAKYDCEADNPDELTFKQGEKIVVTRMLDEDWWKGFLFDDHNIRGVFPALYVTKIKDNLEKKTIS